MINSDFDYLIKQTDIIMHKGWIKNSYNGYGSSGVTFEKSLGIQTNNFEIPDFNGIEIKTKISKRENHLTLFSATPDSYLFEIKRIYETYGCKPTHKLSNKSFNISVYTNKMIYYKSNYYKLKVDRASNKIILLVFDKNKDIIDDKTSWSFDLIKEKVTRKINNLFLIYGERKYENRTVYFRYNRYLCFVFKGFEHFLNELEKGNIRICFSIGTFKKGKRKGQMYDHGTSFNISINHLENIFDCIYKSCA
ncbi:MAG: MvaI/BcnI restriction endonuclease family protein [Bacilli bacterium]|nr:MvaI/BcnI restriction endonuclease family protein [Bacilli bacterium]MBP3635385.1 MvaI/BcnI restriction endonuclease family protein [Bacilli bacterium]